MKFYSVFSEYMLELSQFSVSYCLWFFIQYQNHFMWPLNSHKVSIRCINIWLQWSGIVVQHLKLYNAHPCSKSLINSVHCFGNWIIFELQVVLNCGLKHLAALFLCSSNTWKNLIFVCTSFFSSSDVWCFGSL